MKRSIALARQGRSPSGLLGHIVGRIMAAETQAANRIALDLLELKPDDGLLEIGSGHGRTLAAAAESVTRGTLVGVDSSPVMLQIARRRNRAALRSGRMQIIAGASDQLPFEAAAFDKALAVHVIYFWLRPQVELAETWRVLKPGGRLVIGFRPGEDAGFAANFPAEIYHVRSMVEVETLLIQAGFVEVRTISKALGRGLMAWSRARKPPG
jgi:SAM-dependent methyltransferase